MKGQSSAEFLIVLAALTIIGIMISVYINPGQNGAISKVQDHTTAKIAND